jgi:hypothetical protein
LKDRGLTGLVNWIDIAGRLSNPTKPDQDRLDACLCLLVALHLAEGKQCLVVGNLQTGYIVVPHSAELQGELDARCVETGCVPAAWHGSSADKRERSSSAQPSHAVLGRRHECELVML